MKKVAEKGAIDRIRIRKIKELAKEKWKGLVPQDKVDRILNVKTPMRWYRTQAGKGLLRRWVDKSGAAYIQPVIDKMDNVVVGHKEDYARKKHYPEGRQTAKQRCVIHYVAGKGQVYIEDLYAWMLFNFRYAGSKTSPEKAMRTAVKQYIAKGLLEKSIVKDRVMVSVPGDVEQPEAETIKPEPAKAPSSVKYEQLSLFSPEQLRSSGEDHVSNELLVKLIKEVQAARVEINKVMSMLETDRARMGAASMAFAKTFSGR